MNHSVKLISFHRLSAHTSVLNYQFPQQRLEAAMFLATSAVKRDVLTSLLSLPSGRFSDGNQLITFFCLLSEERGALLTNNFIVRFKYWVSTFSVIGSRNNSHAELRGVGFVMECHAARKQAIEMSTWINLTLSWLRVSYAPTTFLSSAVAK